MIMLCRKVFMYIIITLEVIICQKDSDEGRPYEFGFTIDGQQHRHEKKDQNGIIQGEFGFITADGVYHVTVYATDENGDFKILSMKNIRISAPLDGSPALGPISPEASKYLKKANLPNQIQPAKPQSTTPQKFERIQEPPSLAVTQKAIVSTQKVPYVFTTLSTIGPACGGCGLITTPKPGSKFTFQNPAFSQPNTNIQRVAVNQNEPTLDIQNRFSDTGSLAPGYSSNFASSGKKASQTFDKEFNSDGRQQNSNTGFRDSLSNSQFQQQNKAYTINNAGNTQLFNSNVNPITGEKSSQTIDKVGNFDSPEQKSQSGFKNDQFQQNNGYVNTAGNIQRPDFVGSVGQGLSGPSNTVSTSNNVKSSSGNKAFGGVQSFGTASVSNGAAPKGIQSFGSYQQSGPFEASKSSGGNYGPVDQNRAGPNLNFESVAGQTDKGSLSQDEFGRFLAPPINSNGPNPLLRPQDVSKLPPVVVSDNVIHVMGKKPVDIPIKDKYPGMVDGLPKGVEVKDVTNILYKFKYTVGFHGHYEKGLKDGSKIGGYFVNGRDGISRIVTYVADENGYRPKFKFINLGLDSPDTPNEKTEKTFGLKDFEFVWYPVE